MALGKLRLNGTGLVIGGVLLERKKKFQLLVVDISAGGVAGEIDFQYSFIKQKLQPSKEA